MAISSGTTAFAQNNPNGTIIESESETSGNVIVTKDGVMINGIYYTKAEFKNLLNHAIAIDAPENENTPSPMFIAPGVYFIPGIGQIVIAVTGIVVVAGVSIAAGTWLYNTIVDWLSNSEARTIAQVRAKIPARLRDENGDVDLGQFDQKVNGKTAYKEKGGWTVEKDTAGHGGRKWKLKDKSGDRVASLGENGEVLGK